jgi:D-psicose/D-tagatose/L-ribulose 3-epimerase
MNTLNLSISSIAWQPHEREAVAEIIKSKGYSYIDEVPARLWGDALNPDDVIVLEYEKFLNDTGLKGVGIQSLLYGHDNFNIFDDDNEEMVVYLSKVIELAGSLNFKVLVFGSPRNRAYNPELISKDQVNEIASKFFLKLAEVAQVNDVIIALEPNPAIYNTNFLTTTKETVDFIKRLNHDSIKLNLDLGTLIINNTNVASLEIEPEIIAHAHISVPNLGPIYSNKYSSDVLEFLNYLDSINYLNAVAIEMKSIDSKDNLTHIKKALDFIEGLIHNDVPQA